MTPAVARLGLAAGFSAILAGEALAQGQKPQLPSAAEVGQALALANSCRDDDGFTLCDPAQPVGATFRRLLCVEYGSDAQHRPIIRCVFKDARMQIRSARGMTFREHGDGAIDVIHIDGIWLPDTN